jgi:riboflavin biosynthesis pyrimidine reductase
LAPDFLPFARRKTREAHAASIHPLRTIEDTAGPHGFEAIGNDWTRAYYDGPFRMAPVPVRDLPAIGLVFVQSRDGNTGADDPGDLGGGDTDKHLIYEGLSRVAAHAVMAGATTANGPEVFFSVWRDELVSLRHDLGLPRHPAQIVVTGRGCVDPDECLIFNVPDVPVFVLGSAIACAALAEAAQRRPWVRIIRLEPDGLRAALARLRRDYGIERISAVGGRMTATSLVDEGLVQDLYLTTSDHEGGEPNTPWYAGTKPVHTKRLIAKRGTDRDAGILFEHVSVESATGGDTKPRR